MKSVVIGFLLFCGLTINALAAADDFVYDDRGRLDPFSPVISAAGTMVMVDKDMTAADIYIEGIVADAKGNNAAIINGKIVVANDELGPYKVKSITQEKVVLIDSQQQEIEINIKKGDF